MDVETVLNHVRRLSDEDKRHLYRELARMLAPLYRERWEAGRAADAARRAADAQRPTRPQQPR